MWCDDFDADLLAVVPGAAEALGPAGDVRLETFSHLTGGKINLPSCWNTDEGFVAFFWTDKAFRPDECFATSAPAVECTFLEAIRDEWVHDAAISVNGQVVWRPPVRLMMRLMYDVRGWTVLTEAERDTIRLSVRISLGRAAGRLAAVVNRKAVTDGQG